MNYQKYLRLAIFLRIAFGVAGGFLYGATVPKSVRLAKAQNLRVYLESEPKSLDPHHCTTLSESWVLRDLFEGLVILDERGEISPGTASHWEHDESGKTWTFSLRPTARWSNGEGVTAEDFVYSWKRLASEGGDHAEELVVKLHLAHANAVRTKQLPPEALGIEALDEHTLRLHLDQPVLELPKFLCSTRLLPVHPCSLIQQGQHPECSNAQVVCNGAYCTPRNLTRGTLSLDRNTCYWDAVDVCITQVEYLFKDLKSTIFARLWLGQVDLTDVCADGAVYETLKQQYPKALHAVHALGWQGIVFNTKDPVLRNPAFRKALNLVIDREAVLKAIGDLGAQATHGFLPPTCNPSLPAWVQLTYRDRCALARRTMEQAGLARDRLPSFELYYRDAEIYPHMADALIGAWKRELNLNVVLKPEPSDRLIGRPRLEPSQMRITGCLFSEEDPLSVLSYFLPSSGYNDSNYDSESYNRLLAAARFSSLAAVQLEYCQRANLLLAEDVPCIPLFFLARPCLISPKLGGWTLQKACLGFYSKDLYRKA